MSKSGRLVEAGLSQAEPGAGEATEPADSTQRQLQRKRTDERPALAQGDVVRYTKTNQTGTVASVNKGSGKQKTSYLVRLDDGSELEAHHRHLERESKPLMSGSDEPRGAEGRIANPAPQSENQNKKKMKKKKRKKSTKGKNETDNSGDGPESQRDEVSDVETPHNPKSQPKGKDRRTRADQKWPQLPTDGIMVTMIRSDKLRLSKKITHPTVSVILLDEETGESLRMVLPDATGQNRGGLRTSESFSLRDHGTLAPAWNFVTKFAVDYDEVITDGRKIVAFFVLAEHQSGRTSSAKRTPLAGAICWGFMRLKQHYANKVSRLQLYEFSARSKSNVAALERAETKRRSTIRNGDRGNGDVSESGESGEGRTDPQERIAKLCLAEVAQSPSDRRSYPATLYARIDPYRIEVPNDAASEDEANDDATVTRTVRGEPRDQRVVVQTNWRRQQGETCIVPRQIQLAIPLPCGAFSLGFSPDGHYLAVGACDEDPELEGDSDRRDHHAITIFHVHDAWTSEVDPEHDEIVFVQLNGHQSLVQSLTWSPDSQYLLSASSDSTVRLWNLAAVGCAKLLQAILPHPCFVYCAEFHPSPETHLVFSGAFDGVIRVWEWGDTWCEETATLVGEIAMHTAHVNALAFDDHGRKMITADADGELRIWVSIDEMFRSWSPHVVIQEPGLRGIPVDSIRLHPSGRRLLVHARDNIVRMLDLRTNLFMQRYHGSFNQRVAAGSCLSACGTFVYAGSEDGSVHVWDCDTGNPVFTYSNFGITGPVCGVAFHPHDHIAAFCSFGRGQPLVIWCAEPAAIPDRGRPRPLGSVWTMAGGVSNGPPNRLPPLRASTPDTTATALALTVDARESRAPLTASLLQTRDVLDVPRTAHGTLDGSRSSTMGTLPYRQAEPSEADIVSVLQEERKKQVDNLLASTRQRISRRREILDASSRTPLPIGGARNGHASSPETVIGYRQSTLTESSFASTELRALLKRELGQDIQEEVPSQQYWAAFNCQAARPDELSFAKGDKFVSVTEKDGEWWKMIREDGQEGWVPATYVRPTPVTPKSSAPRTDSVVPSGLDKPAVKGMATHSTPNDDVERAHTPQQRRKTPKRTSEVGKALRESRNQRKSRAKSAQQPSYPSSAFTEVTGI